MLVLDGTAQVKKKSSVFCMDIPKTVKWTLKIEMMSYLFIFFYFFIFGWVSVKISDFSRGITGLGSSKYELTLEKMQVWKKPLYE